MAFSRTIIETDSTSNADISASLEIGSLTADVSNDRFVDVEVRLGGADDLTGTPGYMEFITTMTLSGQDYVIGANPELYPVGAQTGAAFNLGRYFVPANGVLTIDLKSPEILDDDVTTVVIFWKTEESNVMAVDGETASASATVDFDDLATALVDIADVPTVAEFNARTLVAASYFNAALDTVINVSLVATTTTNLDMRGTDGANTVVPMTAALSQTEHDASQTILTTIDTKIGSPSDIGSGATLSFNNFDAAGVGFSSGDSQVGILAAVVSGHGSIAAAIADVPTNAEFAARTLLAADYFDWTTDIVANVTLVATTTTNSDMRGTDSAFLAASAPANFSALSISVGGAINDVVLVATTTTNTDVRGTDGANTVVPMTAALSQTEHDATQAAVGAIDTAPMRGTDGANTVVPMTAALSQTEHDSTQTAVGAIDTAPMRGTDGANTVVPDNTQGATVIAQGDIAWVTAVGFSTFNPAVDSVDVGSIAGETITVQMADGFQFYFDVVTPTKTMEDIGGGSGSCPIGPGSIEVTLNVDDGTNPIEGVGCWITTDVGGSNTIAGTLNTNAQGDVIFMLDAGVYYWWKQLSGFNFDNPTQITVS